MRNRKSLLPLIALLLLSFPPCTTASGEEPADTETGPRREERAAAIAEAQRGLAKALRALHEAQAQIEQARVESHADLARLRGELSDAHRALREASREVARAHRDLALADRRNAIYRTRLVNLGDRAVLGVVLGPADERGIRITGVSPGGPAERAGLREDDILVAIRDVDLTGQPGVKARAALLRVMDEVKDGEAVAVGVLRDGERQEFTVTAEKREPASWQSLLRLPPRPPAAPVAPGAPLEGLQLPELDHERLSRRIAEIGEQLEQLEFPLLAEDWEPHDFDLEFFQDVEALSQIGGDALAHAGVWFGLPLTHGLELVSVNPALGRYFEAERGVLVVRAEDDNAYGLEAGDVVQSAAGRDVESPSDLLRALRDAEPGSEIELVIKRDRREQTLVAAVPENRLGRR